MRVIMPAIIDQAGRKFNVDEADGEIPLGPADGVLAKTRATLSRRS